MRRFLLIEELTVRISSIAATKPFLESSRMKGIVLGILVTVLLAASGCTRVSVQVRASGGGLTGAHCKLQRPLTNQHQETNVWCWAASAHTVIEYLKNEKLKQCDILQAVYRGPLAYEWAQLPKDSTDGLEPPNCCMNMPEQEMPPGSKNVEVAQRVCYQNGWPESVFATAEFHTTYDGFEYDWSIPYPHGLNWDEIVEEICADRPMISVIFYGREIGGGGHAVVVGGYSELEDGSQWVHVYDPGYNTEEDDSYVWPYDVYLGDPGVFTHVRDYKNISIQ
jgi:hypothetical protein